ncbi:MAG: 4-hydroxy-3-methylbut-2-enyl diphosphate reductase [Gemmatimonadetes bacterium]|nr:4-hydroxy-3-methylbut-2-enyl diphosphate reductase [Gemmatimonadota bacterium]
MTRSFSKAPSKEIRAQVGVQIESDFSSRLVGYLRENGYKIQAGDTTIKLAAEFGFCYGVDRAIEYAFAARHRFPNRRIWLTGEIIHNPGVNERLREMKIDFLPNTDDKNVRYADLAKDDVILIPAFGADSEEMTFFLNEGYEIVDTTCGSVLNVWKRVRKYANEGFTALVHGKYDHEETIATVSQVCAESPDGHYLVVLDLDEARDLAAMIVSGDWSDFDRKFPAHARSKDFDPARDLMRIGVANQTTMLESESREIGEIVRAAIAERYGAGETESHFLSFDTICSATEDRQRAVKELLSDGVDRMIVIGGYNSSNTGHLLELSSAVIPAYHIVDAGCLITADRIIAKPNGREPVEMTDWLPEGPQVIGVTGGASTPDSIVGLVIERILQLRGVPLPSLD